MNFGFDSALKTQNTKFIEWPLPFPTWLRLESQKVRISSSHTELTLHETGFVKPCGSLQGKLLVIYASLRRKQSNLISEIIHGY